MKVNSDNMITKRILLVVLLFSISLLAAVGKDVGPVQDNASKTDKQAVPALTTGGLAGNLIENPSFESCDNKGIPKGWIFKNKSETGSIRLDRNMAADGINSVRLSQTQEKNGAVLVGARLDRMKLNGVKAGTPMKLSLKVNTNGDPGVKFMYYLERIREKTHLKTPKSPVETSYFGWMDKSIVFEYPDDGPVTEARVWIYLMSPGNLNVDSVVLSLASEEDVKAARAVKTEEGAYVRATGLPPRHAFTTAEAPSRLAIEFKLAAREFTVTLRKIGEEVVRTWTIENPRQNAICVETISLPPLGDGTWKLEYTWEGGKDQDYFRIAPDLVRRTAFTKENILLLNGKRFFPIGIYPALETKEMFEVYHKAGFNTVVLHGVPDDEQARRYASMLNPLEMAVFFSTSFCVRMKDKVEASRREIHSVLASSKHFPRFIGVTADELCWGSFATDDVQPYYEAFFQSAPDYLAWHNHAPRLTGSTKRDSFSSVRQFTRLSDVTGVDIYPVPDGKAGHNNLSDKSLACVGKYTDLVSQSGWGEIPVWMILQAFSWDGYNDRKIMAQPLPTYKELRFMVWNAITHGARGIFFYQPGRLASVWYGQFGKDISNVSRELASVSDVIVNGKTVSTPGAPAGVRFMAFDSSGDRLFVAINEQKEKSAKITLPLDGMFYRLPDGSTFEECDYELMPYEVLLLSSRPIAVSPSEGFVYSGPSKERLTINGSWVAHPRFTNAPKKTVFFRQDFVLDDVPTGKTVLRFCNDDTVEFTINDKRIQTGKGGFRVLTEVDVSHLLKKGSNRLAGTLFNFSGPTGVIYELKADRTLLSSGEGTLFSEDGNGDWGPPHVIGTPPVRPWALPHAIEEVGSP